MKTRDEIDKLKQSWLKDPCYALVDSEGVVAGFEEHEAELLAFQTMHRERWRTNENRLRRAIEKIGGRLAFPGCGYNEGMTLRQWLIGQAMASLVNYMDGDAVESAILRADAIVERLAKEELKRESES